MIHKLFFSCGHLAGRSGLTQVGLENARNTSFPQSSKIQKPRRKWTLLVKYRTSNSKSIYCKVWVWGLRLEKKTQKPWKFDRYPIPSWGNSKGSTIVSLPGPVKTTILMRACLSLAKRTAFTKNHLPWQVNPPSPASHLCKYKRKRAM